MTETTETTEGTVTVTTTMVTTEEFSMAESITVRIFIDNPPDNIGLESTLQEYDYNNPEQGLIGPIDEGEIVLNDVNFDNKNQVYFRPVYRGKHYKVLIGGNQVHFGGDPYLYIKINAANYLEVQGIIDVSNT
ncbi:hypothetical protein [Kordia sp.]|uniref:hypothetical protein n=1 Tax=Kordia sp. TaxID=1965332 RepID=UPI0025BB0C50|nr:hypothetical protein [Kordia sp.]MCH2194403.1 hypothetical protein [Kordia sp.]